MAFFLQSLGLNPATYGNVQTLYATLSAGGFQDESLLRLNQTLKDDWFRSTHQEQGE